MFYNLRHVFDIYIYIYRIQKINGFISTIINLGRHGGSTIGSFFGGSLITWFETAATIPYFTTMSTTMSLLMFGIQLIALKHYLQSVKTQKQAQNAIVTHTNSKTQKV